MLAAKWFDMVVGVDIHIVMVPTPVPVPTPLPHPFTGLIFDPAGLAVGTAISAGISAVMGGPILGPVLINNIPVANTGTEGTNKLVMPHFPMPPGTAWAPVPAAPKPPIPGKPPDPPVPTPVPSNDTILITGSKTVHMGGSNACRLGDLSMSCAEPVRLPTSTVIAIPMGAPVLVGGPPALDLLSAAMGAIRTKWVTGKLRRLFRAADGSWKSKLICLLTGHPVDVVSGMVVTDAVDFELPGPIPFKFERTYYSKSTESGPLGYGWGHAYDQCVWVEKNRIVQRSADGRELYFELVDVGGTARNQSDDLVLTRNTNEFKIEGKDRLVHVFAPAGRKAGIWPLIRIEDPRGNRVSFSYDKSGRLVEVIDSSGRLIRFVNDAKGRIISISLPHPSGSSERFDVVRFEYDAQDDLVTAFDSSDQPFRYAYKHHLLVQETARNGLSFYFAYDGLGPDAKCVRTWGDGGIFDHVLTYDTKRNLTIREDSYGAQTLYHANEAGLVEKIVDSLNRERTFAYDEECRQVSETDTSGAKLTMEYDERGNITLLTDADGVSRAYVYNSHGQPVQEFVGSMGEVRHSYTTYGEVAESVNALGGGVTQEYSERGDPVRICSRGGTVIDLAWDADRNLSQVVMSGEGAVRARYDALGRCVGVEHPDGKSTRYELDLQGRPVAVVRSWIGRDRYEYDAQGLLVREVDSGGGEVIYEYGNYNKVTAVRSSALGDRTFEFDNEGEIVAAVNEKGERYRYVRDSEGDIVEEIDFAGRKTEFRLDPGGRVTEIVEPSGKTKRLEWTPGGRLRSVAYEDGGFDRFAYDDRGLIVEAENERGTLKRAYDGVGRLVTESWNDFELQHEYDLDDRRIRSTSSDGLSTEYGYDVGDRLSRLRVDDAFELQREYDRLGNIETVRLPGAHTQHFRHDANGFPQEQTVESQDGTVLSYRRYEFTPVGKLAGVYDAARGLKTFGFGSKGIERVLRDGELAESYVYDEAGEWLPAEELGEVGPGGRLLRYGGISYDYDEDGRVVRKTKNGHAWEYQYNDRGQIVTVIDPDGQRVAFEYDPFWRRVGKKSDSYEVRWDWDGRTPYREVRIRGSVVEKCTYLFEPDGFTPLMAVRDGHCFSLVTDHIGTPQEVIDDKGKVVWAADYGAWGNVTRIHKAGFDNPIRFPGQWCDDETGLHYNRFRYYDPDTGRYTTPDPAGLVGGMNLYAYASDPLTFEDPLGLGAGCVRRFVSSYKIFLQSGIRPKHARAIMRQAMETGETYAFRNIGTLKKRIGAFVGGIFGLRPKPVSVKKIKSDKWGIVRNPETGKAMYRSDYDPAFYRNADGSVMSNEQAEAANEALNKAIGGPEIQHPTHVTMPDDEVAREVGPPTTSTAFHPDGTTSQMTPSQIRDSPGMPWRPFWKL